ncbi:5868_t:CDS:2 [Paraglomus brasilianum]|uniref:5868_t:CDS:1 n=1 Tax=Paraglomus brasilianum TaxID=144538 RepID=A0A9N8VHK5_9GLOM|nr:5868_t:CDS:2 [Paraglomus brasilianum]
MRLNYPDNAPRDPDAFNNFIENELGRRLGYENFHLYRTPIEKINTVRRVSGTKRFTPAIRQQKSVCKNTRVKTRQPPDIQPKKTNYAVRFEEEYHSDSTSVNSEESEEEDLSDQEESSEEDENNSLTEQRSSKKSSTIAIIQKIFRASFKSMIEALIKECPESLLPQVLDYLGKVYNSLKDRLLDNFASKYSSKEKETNTLNFAIKNYYAESLQSKEAFASAASCLDQQVKKSYWPNPTREINFIQSIISDDIAEKTGHKIDKLNVPSITGIASKANVIGTVYDLPVTIGSGDDAITIYDNFSVVKAERNRNGDYKSLVLFGTPWLNKIGWEPIANREFKVNNNGKCLTIPLSVHKSQREVFTAEKLEHVPVVWPQKASVNDLVLKKN